VDPVPGLLVYILAWSTQPLQLTAAVAFARFTFDAAQKEVVNGYERDRHLPR
jgi:hypothetical protein